MKNTGSNMGSPIVPSSTGTGTGRKNISPAPGKGTSTAARANVSSGAGKANGVDKSTGVSCGVDSCKYHGFMNCCNAAGINVQNEHNTAHMKAETFCSTFSPKSDARIDA